MIQSCLKTSSKITVKKSPFLKGNCFFGLDFRIKDLKGLFLNVLKV